MALMPCKQQEHYTSISVRLVQHACCACVRTYIAYDENLCAVHVMGICTKYEPAYQEYASCMFIYKYLFHYYKCTCTYDKCVN